MDAQTSDITPGKGRLLHRSDSIFLQQFVAPDRALLRAVRTCSSNLVSLKISHPSVKRTPPRFSCKTSETSVDIVHGFTQPSRGYCTFSKLTSAA